MSEGARPPTFLRRKLPFVLLAPAVVVAAVAFAALAGGGSGSALQLAPGAVGGLHPLAGGFVADSTVLEDCGGDPSCLEQGFGNLAYREGPKAALTLFESRLESDDDVEKDCHRIAHTIGSAALLRFGGDVARAFATGSPACVSGYYHGILERAFLGIASKARLVEVARSLCLGQGMRRRGFLDYQCRHGLGHGLMIQTGYDLPLALSMCAGLGSGWDHKACAGGVFMENLNTRFGFRSPWLDDADPLFPCERVQPRDRRSCYLRASWRIHTLARGDLEEVVAACSRLGAWARTCFQGFGRDTAEETRYGAAAIRARCALAGSGQGDCLMGASRTVANASGRPGVEPAASICRGAPRTERARCFSGVGLVLGMLESTVSSRRTACKRVAGEYEGACTRAAMAEVDPSGRDSWG